MGEFGWPPGRFGVVQRRGLDVDDRPAIAPDPDWRAPARLQQGVGRTKDGRALSVTKLYPVPSEHAKERLPEAIILLLETEGAQAEKPAAGWTWTRLHLEADARDHPLRCPLNGAVAYRGWISRTYAGPWPSTHLRKVGTRLVQEILLLSPQRRREANAEIVTHSDQTWT